MAKTNIKKAKAAAKAAKTEKQEIIETVAIPEVEQVELVEAPKTEVKAEAKTETKAVKAEKTETKKAPAKKTAAKTAVKVVIEYQGRQVSEEDILAAVQSAAGKAKTLEIYVKPEDGAVYYVADGETGKVSF